MILYSCISSAAKHKALLRGAFLGGAGAFVLLVSGVLFPPELLRILGPWLFISSLFLLLAGWYPYGKVRRLEKRPHSIQVHGDQVSFSYHQRDCISLSYDQIVAIEWKNEATRYGFLITTKDPLPIGPMSWTPFHPSLLPTATTLFLPFFSYRSWQEWQEEAPELPWQEQHDPCIHIEDLILD